MPPPTIALLGCGKLSSALLTGILLPPHPPRIIATVHTPLSFTALRHTHASNPLVTILLNANPAAARRADICILGVEPAAYGAVLAEEGMREALAGKVLVTVMGGVSAREVRGGLYGDCGEVGEGEERACVVVRVMPNTAAAVGASVTLLFEEEGMGEEGKGKVRVVEELFGRVGVVRRIAAGKGGGREMAAPLATLAASTAAFFAVVLEGVVDGAVGMGVAEGEARAIAAESMRGCAALVAGGEDGGEVGRRIATEGGSTAVGLGVMEREGVRGVMAEVVRVTAGKAAGLGMRAVERGE